MTHFMAQTPRANVTLKEVADAAGVSRMTVSLSLRDHPSLPPATRRRIRRIADRLGYRGDPDIVKLMEKIREKKTNHLPNVIGYLTAHPQRLAWRAEPTQRMYYEGACRRAEECGYQIEEFWLREAGMTEKRLSEIIRNRGIEGVIVAPVPVAQNLFQQFRWEYVSAVELGYSLINPSLHRCCNHQFQSMLRLMRSLQAAGYRDIGLAMARDQDERVNCNWSAAYLVTQSQLSKHRNIPVLLTPDWNRQVFAQWLKRHRPEVIVTISPHVGQWLEEMGIRTPQDVGLANVDLRPDMSNVTGIDQHSTQVGAAAVNSLISLMRFSERGVPINPRILMVEGSYVQGATTRGILKERRH